jgi:hypothetical protein
MAEWTCTACPTQLQAAHNADKIFVVKRKGQSPRFKEQRKSNSATHPATEAPHGESSSKRTRKGGKQEKARKARAAHNIVSSAFVPVMVLNRMQESHHMEAGPSTSCVEEVVKQPTPTPVTVIGGPSRAPVRSAAPRLHSFYPAIKYHILEGCYFSYAVRVRVELLKNFLQHGKGAYAPEEGRCLTHCRTTMCYVQISRGTG